MNEFKRNLAVVIGINDYQNGIAPLQTAVRDATAIAKILQNKYNYELIHPEFNSEAIIDQYATKEQLKTLLTDILPNKIKPTEHDRLLFYFAGHGIARNSDDQPQGFLVPQDGNMKRDLRLNTIPITWLLLRKYNCMAGILFLRKSQTEEQSLLRMIDVHDWLSELKCRHLLIILDCCFAGQFRWASTRKLIPVPEEIHWEHYYRFIKYPAWQVITSAAHNQEALDFLNNRDREITKKHSPFAEGLIEALGEYKADLTKNKVITTPELYLYLRKYVEDNSQERQTPGFFPLKKHDRGEYIFKLPDIEPELKPAPELDEENNPYRGLESFEERHASLFFGREEIIEELLTKVVNLVQLNNQLTVVSGISGSGKSSLVKAGLIPRLTPKNPPNQETTPKWHVLHAITKDQNGKDVREIMRPGSNPYSALARVISQLDVNPAKKSGDTTILGKQLQDDSRKFIKVIQGWSQQHPNSRLLLVIDQFEELITMAVKTESVSKEQQKPSWLQQLKGKFIKSKPAANQDVPEDKPEEWQRFIALLANILQQCPQLSLVVTLRSDFEPRFQDSAFNGLWAQARFVVRPMRSDELREAVEKPAAEKALFFEPPEIVDRLVDEVSQMPGALPLLSFTLSEMYIELHQAWVKEGKEGRALTVTNDFDQKGGVAGALTQKANEEYEKLAKLEVKLITLLFRLTIRPISSTFPLIIVLFFEKELGELLQNTMRRVMLRMVELEGGEAVRRRVLASELKYPNWEENQRKDAVLKRLLESRLIVTGKDAESNETYYEPAHDFLVRGWERLQIWIIQEQENLVLQKQLTPAARSWKKENTGLWDNDSRLPRLKEIQDKDTIYDNWFNKIESEFVSQSNAKKKKDVQVRWGIATIVIFILSILTIEALVRRNQAIQSQINTLITLSESLTSRNDQLGALLASTQAGFKLNNSFIWLDKKTHHKIKESLRNNLFEIRELNRMNKHYDKISDVKFSPNGKIIASASEDGAVKLWWFNLLKTNQNIGNPKNEPLEIVGQRMTTLSFSPNSDMIVTGSDDNKVRLWRIDGTQIKKFDQDQAKNGHSETITSVVFSPDGQMIASASEDQKIQLRHLDGKLDKQLDQKSKITSIQFSPDGQKLLVGSQDGKVTLWSLQTGNILQIFDKHKGNQVLSVSFSKDGRKFASSSKDKTVKIWDVNNSEKPLKIIDSITEVTTTSFSPNGELIILGGVNTTIQVWKINNSNAVKLQTLEGHSERITSIDFHPDGKTIVSGSWDNTVKLWTLNNSNYQVFEHPAEVWGVRFSPDGQRIASAGAGVEKHNPDNKLRLWDINGNNLKTYKTHIYWVTSVDFHPGEDSNIIVSGSADKTIKLWDIDNSKKSLKTFTGHEGKVWGVSFSPDGKMIASASDDRTVKLWDVDNSEKSLKTFTGHEGKVWGVSFSPDGKIIASASDDRTVKLWDVDNSKKPLKTFTGHNSTVIVAKFSLDGKMIASASDDRTIKLWDVDSGKPIRTIEGHTGAVTSLSFSPDEEKLVSASEDKTIKIWRIEDGLLLQTLRGHKDRIWGVDISSDGQRIASASDDKSIIVWNFENHSWDKKLNETLLDSCYRLHDYLQTNQNVLDEESQICDSKTSLSTWRKFSLIFSNLF